MPLNVVIFLCSLPSPDSVAGVSVGRPVCTESCSRAGSGPRMSPPSSVGTGIDPDEHQLLSDTHYQKYEVH